MSSYLALPNQLVEFPAPMKKATGHQEHPFSLVGNTGIYKQTQRAQIRTSASLCIFYTQRQLNVRKPPLQTGQAVKTAVCTWLGMFHITKTNQYGPCNVCNASRWMKRKGRSSDLCSLVHIEERHFAGTTSSINLVEVTKNHANHRYKKRLFHISFIVLAPVSPFDRRNRILAIYFSLLTPLELWPI